MRSIHTADAHVADVEPLVSPAELRAEIPLSPTGREAVLRGSEAIRGVLRGEDDRIVVITGPCSVHDPAAVLTYAERLARLAADVRDEIVVVMRVYTEKPRTRFGWKGLISDPHLDGSRDINAGLRVARSLMVQIATSGVPVGTEFLDPSVPGYLSDAVSWGCIGARTVQSQIHRQLASGLPMPIGFKNATDGEVLDAVDAVAAATQSHTFPASTDDGRQGIVTTTGNPDGHVVLRGGSLGPNYGPIDVAKGRVLLGQAGLPNRLLVDASHGNSGKDHRRQELVAENLAWRLHRGETGIAGVMLESFLVAGNQKLELGRSDQLVYGRSVTDACIDWTSNVRIIQRFAAAVEHRRVGRRAALAG
ncbi:3-deoxy-7-phosphoheptulonate synthase [Actinomycetes bacterium KLBMP 9759]